MPHCDKKMLSFFLTTKCNLCCRYCYNAKERNAIEEQTIPLDVAKAAIDWYFENSDSRHIRFYGLVNLRKSLVRCVRLLNMQRTMKRKEKM